MKNKLTEKVQNQALRTSLKIDISTPIVTLQNENARETLQIPIGTLTGKLMYKILTDSTHPKYHR